MLSSEVIIEERTDVRINDDQGDRVESRWRYDVAHPTMNIQRGLLSECIQSRRGNSKESLSRAGMASAVSAADEFATLEYPSQSNRRHYSMCLRGAGLTYDEADVISGVDQFYERPAGAKFARK